MIQVCLYPKWSSVGVSKVSRLVILTQILILKNLLIFSFKSNKQSAKSLKI